MGHKKGILKQTLHDFCVHFCILKEHNKIQSLTKDILKPMIWINIIGYGLVDITGCHKDLNFQEIITL